MSKSIAKLITGVAGVVLLSRILGFIREMIIAQKFGTSADYDLYLIAIMLPALAYGVINFSTVYLFVPFLSKKKSKETGELSWTDIWPGFNLVVGSAMLVALLIIFGAPYIMKIWAADYTADNFARIIWYARLTSLMLFFGTTEAFMRAYLNVKKIFVYPAGGYIVYNLFSILTILFFSATLSTGAIVLGLLGGLVVQNIYLLARLLKYDPFAGFRWNMFNTDTTAILKAGMIIILIEIINRSYFLIDRYVALDFGEGIISGLNYSQVLVQLPESIVGFAIGSVVFPFFSDNAADKNERGFFDIYRSTILSSLIISVFVAIFFVANAYDLVNLLFSRGVFNEQSVLITSSILIPYSISIAALFVITTSMRAIYSRGYAGQLLLLTLFVFAVKIAGNFILPKFFSYPGISLATSLTHLIFAFGLVILILNKLSINNKYSLLGEAFKIIIIGSLLAVGAIYLNQYWSLLIIGNDKPAALGRMILSGIILLPLYLLLIYLGGMLKHLRLRITNAG